MNEGERFNKNLLIIMFIGCVALLLAVVCFNVFYSPKHMTPAFIENYASSESDDISSDPYESISESSKTEENIFPLNINTATEEELQLIPDIGPATAKLIIEYRNEYGTIVSFDELLSINGIGEKTVEKLKNFCKIN